MHLSLHGSDPVSAMATVRQKLVLSPVVKHAGGVRTMNVSII